MLDRIHSRAKIMLALHTACKANKTLIDLVNDHAKRWDEVDKGKSAWYDSHTNMLVALNCEIVQSIVRYDADTALVATELMTTINELVEELMVYGNKETEKFTNSINKRYEALGIDDNTKN